MRITAELASVEFEVMTSSVFFAIVRVRDLKAAYEQTKTQQEIAELNDKAIENMYKADKACNSA